MAEISQDEFEQKANDIAQKAETVQAAMLKAFEPIIKATAVFRETFGDFFEELDQEKLMPFYRRTYGWRLKRKNKQS